MTSRREALTCSTKECQCFPPRKSQTNGREAPFHICSTQARRNLSTVLQLTSEYADAEVDAFELGSALADPLVVPFAMKRSYLGLSKKTQLKLSFWLAATSRLLHNCKVKVHQHQSEKGGAICVLKSQLESQTTRRKRNGCQR